MALWIAGYMVTGLVSKGALAKRLNQVSRLSGAITVPDVLRDRFRSPLLGVLASLFLLFFPLFNLVGQFKAGGLIMRQACGGIADTSAAISRGDGDGRDPDCCPRLGQKRPRPEEARSTTRTTRTTSSAS